MLLDEPLEVLAPIIIDEPLKALREIVREEGLSAIIIEQNAGFTFALAQSFYDLGYFGWAQSSERDFLNCGLPHGFDSAI